MKNLKKFLMVNFFVFLVFFPISILAENNCASYATLTITSDKTTYLVGKPFSGEG